MADESPLETTAREEAAKAPARAAASNPIDSYFSLIGNQLKTTGKIIKTTAKVTGTAAVVSLAGCLGYVGFGLDAIITQGGLIFGDWLAKWKNKEPLSAKDTMVKGVAGSALGGLLSYAFPAINSFGNSVASFAANYTSSITSTVAGVATKTGTMIGTLFPAFLYAENNILYPILDPKKEPFNWDQFKEAWKGAIKSIGLPAAANICFMPAQYQIPGAAAITTLYGYASAGKKEEEKKEAAQPNNVVNMPQQGTQQQRQYRTAA